VVRSVLGRLAAPLLISALCACSQSLFDENVSDEDPGADDGDGTVSDDGGDDGDDAGDDGGDGVVPPPGCPEPCQGDPVTDFTLEQGGASGRWLYLQDLGDGNGSGFEDLTAGTYQGADAWVVENDAGPAIVNCADDAAPDVCAGVSESLVLVPAAEKATDPVLAFRAPNNGSYRLVGQFRLPDGVEGGVSREILVSRNGRHDVLRRFSFLTSAEPTALEVDVEAFQGDNILLILPATDGAPIAFDFAVTLLGGEGEIFPGRCMFAATFSGEEPLRDLCGGAGLQDLDDEIDKPPTEPSTEGPSVNEQHGTARVLAPGRYLASGGAPLDYRADFTIQFWAQMVNPQPFDSTPFADWNEAVSGGVSTFFDDKELSLQACFFWDDPGNPKPSACINGAAGDEGWHFYRISRSAEGGMISLCVDGVLQDGDAGPAGFNMTSDEAPRLGRNVVYNPAYFAGSIDDVRVFRRALPCASGP
jgi:Concanavalin A-like lectin/glucanases superfamily